ncbi:hypothetical protein P7K49_040240 [Saguinus oedipus]|uniref:Uncharacterized protein n=1 Tax=Saguinus oedipus TaxID=9490 RepID=A0ABQ9T8P7_SAGOE|nr:hypothetical protein P7K49_040240 [Saguinus oedipus]
MLYTHMYSSFRPTWIRSGQQAVPRGRLDVAQPASLLLPLAQGCPGCPGPEALLLPPDAAGPRGPDREAAQLCAPREVTLLEPARLPCRPWAVIVLPQVHETEASGDAWLQRVDCVLSPTLEGTIQ